MDEVRDGVVDPNAESTSGSLFTRNPGLLSVFKIRWVLEDQIVSALLHSGAVSSATLHKVAAHIVHSSGRPHCHSEDVPLQFVFGPEQSLEKFREARTRTHTHTLYFLSQ